MPPLVEALESPNPRVRFYSAWVLGETGKDAAIEPLIRLLKDEVDHVRGSTARALGEIGDERAVGPLARALADRRWTPLSG